MVDWALLVMAKNKKIYNYAETQKISPKKQKTPTRSQKKNKETPDRPLPKENNDWEVAKQEQTTSVDIKMR